jgi:cytochrome c biogenesis protein CcmG, thiol:disulfide interchange protein DsbE
MALQARDRRHARVHRRGLIVTRPLKLGAQAVAVALVLALLVLLVWRVTHPKQSNLPALVRAGKEPAAPVFSLPRLDGQGKVELAALRGKAVVINFWASWCGPCKKESPRLQAAWLHYGPERLVVVGIDTQDFIGDARKFVRKQGLTYPIVHDASGKTYGPYGLSGFPETFFVNRDGKVVGYVKGEVSRRELTENIQRALA